MNEKVDEFLNNLKFESDEDVAVKFQELLDLLEVDGENLGFDLNEMINFTKNDNQTSNKELAKARELLKKATNAKDDKEAYKLAKKAYETSSECIEALMVLTNLEENPLKRLALLKEGIKKEKERLQKEKKYKKFNSDEIEDVMNLKDYLVLNYAFANTLIEEGKIKKAIEVLKEIIELNQDDFLNARHILMSCYAYLENEKDLLELVNKYNEENLPSLLPLLILYYKQENDEKALFYLDKINKKNHYFLKSFKEDLELEKGINLGEFNEGKPSEVIMCNDLLFFLIDQVPSLDTFILENSKKNLKKK